MNQEKIRQLNAATATVSFCESTAADTSAITNFASKVAEVKSKLVIVNGFIILGSAPTSGITVNVAAVRQSMEEHTFKLGNAAFSFAASQSPPDNDLMALAKVTKHSLHRMSKTDCVNECDRIQQLAAAHAADIAGYGVDAGDISDTAAVIILYRAATDDTREAQISTASVNSQASATLKNIMNNLLTKQLDTMANTLRYTNPAWWTQYRAAREIIDPGTFSTVLKIQVLNSVTSQPVTGAKVYRDDAPDSKRTSAKGFVTFKDPDQGNHNFVVKHKLFNDLPVNGIMINFGEKKTVTVLLVPKGGIQTAILQADVAANAIANIDISGIHANENTILTIEVTGAKLRFYKAANTTAPPGPVSYDQDIGTAEMTLVEFITLLGFNPDTDLLNVKNIGSASAHYKLTFSIPV